MLSDEARLLLDVWEGVRDLLPAGKRPEAAEAILRAFADHGWDDRDLGGAMDEDDDLDTAFSEVFVPTGGEDEEEDEGEPDSDDGDD